MYTSALLSAALVLATAFAAPLRRDVETQTVTHLDIVTEYVTAVVWVDPTDVPNASTTFEAVSTTTAVAPVEYHAPSSSSSPAPAPAPTTTTQAPPPPAPTTYVAPPAPTTTQAPVYVAPAPAAPAPETTSTTAPAVVAAPSPAASPAASSSNSESHSGDITYYAVGLGSCGETNTDSEMVVAMSAALMNKATMCGKSITLSYGGVTQQAKVVDTCPGCSAGSLDLSPALFKIIAPNGDGRVKDVKWWWN